MSRESTGFRELSAAIHARVDAERYDCLKDMDALASHAERSLRSEREAYESLAAVGNERDYKPDSWEDLHRRLRLLYESAGVQTPDLRAAVDGMLLARAYLKAVASGPEAPEILDYLDTIPEVYREVLRDVRRGISRVVKDLALTMAMKALGDGLEGCLRERDAVDGVIAASLRDFLQISA